MGSDIHMLPIHYMYCFELLNSHQIAPPAIHSDIQTDNRIGGYEEATAKNQHVNFFIPHRTNENECEALPGVAYPGVRDNCSTLNSKTGYDDE